PLQEVARSRGLAVSQCCAVGLDTARPRYRETARPLLGVPRPLIDIEMPSRPRHPNAFAVDQTGVSLQKLAGGHAKSVAGLRQRFRQLLHVLRIKERVGIE